MRLTCMFSFILLFGAAGLVVFIHLQDPEEIVHQQTPGQHCYFYLARSLVHVQRFVLTPLTCFTHFTGVASTKVRKFFLKGYFEVN